ncbi:MAG: hypothetical protein ACAI25_10420 [Planctomycetota bacterium]
MSINDILKSNEAQGLELKVDKILKGIRAALPQGKTVDVDGKTYTVDELVKRLEPYGPIFSRPRELRAALRRAVADRRVAAPEVAEFLTSLHAGLAGTLGRDNPVIEELGFPPRKTRRDETVEEKLRRVAKAQLTREERHTLGPRQKESLKADGDPTIVVSKDGVKVNPASTDNGTPA